MAKKLSLLMAAVAVLAFAVPAIASAGTVTSSAGTLAAVGSTFTAASTNWTNQTPLGTTKCATVSMSGKLTVNGAGTVEATNSGAGTATGCFLNGSEIKVTDMTLLNLKSTAAGSGTVALTAIDDQASITCHYSAAAAPFTYTVGTAVIKFTNAALVGTPAACNPGSLSAEFTITIKATAVILD